MQELELTWADRLRKEGREEGLQAGLLQGKRQTLKRLLVAKFGGLSKGVEARIDALASVEELDRSLDLVLTAASMKDLGLEG